MFCIYLNESYNLFVNFGQGVSLGIIMTFKHYQDINFYVELIEDKSNMGGRGAWPLITYPKLYWLLTGLFLAPVKSLDGWRGASYVGTPKEQDIDPSIHKERFEVSLGIDWFADKGLTLNKIKTQEQPGHRWRIFNKVIIDHLQI